MLKKATSALAALFLAGLTFVPGEATAGGFIGGYDSPGFGSPCGYASFGPCGFRRHLISPYYEDVRPYPVPVPVYKPYPVAVPVYKPYPVPVPVYKPYPVYRAPCSPCGFSSCSPCGY